MGRMSAAGLGGPGRSYEGPGGPGDSPGGVSEIFPLDRLRPVPKLFGLGGKLGNTAGKRGRETGRETVRETAFCLFRFFLLLFFLLFLLLLLLLLILYLVPCCSCTGFRLFRGRPIDTQRLPQVLHIWLPL